MNYQKVYDVSYRCKGDKKPSWVCGIAAVSKPSAKKIAKEFLRGHAVQATIIDAERT